MRSTPLHPAPVAALRGLQPAVAPTSTAMSHSHLVCATRIDFQFVSRWRGIISYKDREPVWGVLLSHSLAEAEGADSRIRSQYKWCFDKKSLVSQYFFIKLCTNLIDEDRCLAEYVKGNVLGLFACALSLGLKCAMYPGKLI